MKFIVKADEGGERGGNLQTVIIGMRSILRELVSQLGFLCFLEFHFLF